MDRDTIIRLAKDAGLEILDFGDEQEVGCGDGYHIQTDLIERFAALVAAHEREACIDIVAMHGGSVEIEAHIRSRA